MPRHQVKKRKKEFGGGKSNIRQFKNEESEVDDVPEPRPSASASITSPESKPSSSSKKIEPHLSDYDSYITDDGCYDIVNLETVNSLLGNIGVCVKCGGLLKLSSGTRLGLQVSIVIRCTNCKYEVSTNNSPSLPKSKHSEINVRLVYSFRCIGKGEEAAKTLCGLMNLPSPPAFKYYSDLLYTAVKEVCARVMQEAVEESVIENEGDRDLTAIFDGSWQRRGHKSLNGVVSAIAGNTGKVIDVKIFTKCCRCKNRLNNEHTNDCIANYSGVSGGMEVKGVVEMFQESVSKYNVRYKNYLGDGDSASYPAVVASKPYGSDYNIQKLECCGHVQKRMGSRLRKLKTKLGKTKLSDGKSIGGRGRLTQEAINMIQLYYGLAIRRNTHKTLNDMKMAVWAEFFHLGSSNESPNHGLCPPGESSWCKYRKAESTNEGYDHNKHLHLPLAVMEEMKPIFRDLAQPDLLSRCLHGGTQNPSESLNNVIWSRIPKSTFVLKKTLDLGVFEAITSFNEGNIAKCKILSHLGISPGNNCVKALKKNDLVRMQKADKAISEIEKKCRQVKEQAKRRIEDMYEELEDADNPPYEAGLY